MQPSYSRRVTRADVAKAAGTSVAVVSYVINNGPRPVAQATRERVLQAIKHTGYQPNVIAQALASGVSHTYGLVVPDIANPFLASMAHSLQQQAFASGKVLLLGDCGDNASRERELISRLLHRQVDGLIYTSVDRHPCLDLIQSAATPCVMLDRVTPASNISVIQVNECQAAQQITEHLLEHGYREIAIICGPPDMLNSQDRLRGWRQALISAGITPNPAWIFSADYSRYGGYHATLQLLQKPLPQAIFATNEQQAFGCLRALAQHGLQVPQHMALVCFNATEQSQFSVPSLTAVRQPVSLMARMAIDILTHWDGIPRYYEVAFELQPGESCGCPPKNEFSFDESK